MSASNKAIAAALRRSAAVYRSLASGSSKKAYGARGEEPPASQDTTTILTWAKEDADLAQQLDPLPANQTPLSVESK
jgi:hypothetical protein